MSSLQLTIGRDDLPKMPETQVRQSRRNSEKCFEFSKSKRREGQHTGFSLIELLVVVAIIALLMAIMLPSLARAREQARTTRCLSNMRGMEIAAFMYAEENDGHMIEAGLAHTGGTADLNVAWINTLQKYYANKLLARCPSDFSIYWNQPVPGVIPSSMRLTSYGINDFLDPALCPWPIGGYPKLSTIPVPFATVHFVEMAQSGGFAAADHPHVENWTANPPALAATQLQTHVHGGPASSKLSKANYGFLDGHAETAFFSDVYTSMQFNRFDPAVAH